MMGLKIEINREYLEKALDLAEGSATRASNQKGLNELIRKLHQADAKIFRDGKLSIEEIKK